MKTISLPQENLKQIGHKLYMTKHKKRETLESVAREVGVTHPVLSRIENGRYAGLTYILLQKLADYYNIPLKEVV